VKVDAILSHVDPTSTARRLESHGYDGGWTAESGHDPFVPLVLATTATDHLELGTAIAVAFARNPMSMAMLANDVQLASKGRFLLGLGTQIRPHIEKRFSMAWSHPAPRMREFVTAMRAIWDCWNNGTKLDFRGDFYTHTLTTPMFQPEPNPFGPPRVFLAAVGTHMTEVAGEVGDGLLVHPFTTEHYLRDTTVPALERGLAKAGRQRADYEVALSAMVVTGADKEAMAKADRAIRRQLAFYGSTPAYRPVLEAHGWGDAQTELNALSKQGRWEDMADVIDDEMVRAFAVVAPPAEVPKLLSERFAGLLDRISFYLPFTDDHAEIGRALSTLKAAG
jgi:probable F420-dependent oxidoreductase